jgi:uncharacterized protein (UPF0335 family)
MTNRHKVAQFAERLRNVNDAYKADVEAIIEEAKAAEVDPSGLRRLVAWMRRDAVKRMEQEAVDEQYRFLAGEISEPPPEPTEGELAVTIALLRNKATVRQIADELKVSVGKAHKLKVLAAAFTVHRSLNNAEAA